TQGVVIAGESGGIFQVPFDYCLRPDLDDSRCNVGPGEAVPEDGVFLFYTSAFGRLETTAPTTIKGNQPVTFSLFVRESGDTTLALIDSSSVTVDAGALDVRADVSGDR